MRAPSALFASLALGILASAPHDLRAQSTEDFKIEEIEVDFQRFKGGFSAWPKKKPGVLRIDEWMQVEVKFRAEPKDIEGNFLDEIEVRIHVLTPEDPKGMFRREVYTAEVRFAPVPKSNELYAVAYLPPAVVEMHGGRAALQNGCNVAAEVFFKGRPVAELELKSKGERAGEENWYTRGGKKDVLLNRRKTPFLLDSWDRYLPEVEPTR